MSKQEILAWSSLATSSSVVFFYVLIVFGWPDFLPDYAGLFTKIFFNLFWIAVVIEIALELGERKQKVDKDERDFIIEARGLQRAYNFLSFAVAVVVINWFLSDLFGEFSEVHSILGEARTTFHILFIVLFVSNLIKRTTQIYYYRQPV